MGGMGRVADRKLEKGYEKDGGKVKRSGIKLGRKKKKI